MSQRPPPSALFWPLEAAASATRFWSALASADQKPRPQPRWASPNRVVAETPTLRLRCFSARRSRKPPVLVVAPYALHGATLADMAPGHSLMRTLRASGVERLFLVEWRSATPQMRDLGIEAYIADLALAIDLIGGRASLVGLCQGGWVSLVLAATLPDKVAALALAGSPVDTDAEASAIASTVRRLPAAFYESLVQAGDGRARGEALRTFWSESRVAESDRCAALQIACGADPDAEAWFEEWDAVSVDLPGVYYLQTVDMIFRRNLLARGELRLFGRRVDLARIAAPLLLLAGAEDTVVPPAQTLAAEGLLASSGRVESLVADAGHLALFFGARTLASAWPGVGRWLAAAPRPMAAAA